MNSSLFLSIEKRFNSIPSEEKIAKAAETGVYNYVEYFYEKKYPITKSCFDNAAKIGSISIIKFLRKKIGNKWDSSTAYFAAKEGYFYIVRYLCDDGFKCDERIMDLAFNKKDYTFIKYGLERNFPLYSYTVFGDIPDSEQIARATKIGSLRLVKHLYNNKFPINKLTFQWAAISGNTEILDFLIEKAGHKWINSSTAFCAIHKGNYHIVRYLYEKGYKCDERIIVEEYKKKEKNKDFIFYCLRNKFPLDIDTIYSLSQLHPSVEYTKRMEELKDFQTIIEYAIKQGYTILEGEMVYERNTKTDFANRNAGYFKWEWKAINNIQILTKTGKTFRAISPK